MLLQRVFVGKAREIYIQLDVEQAANYDNVKELILKGYELVPEAKHQKFKSFEKLGCQTYKEFARSKEQLFDRWCHSQKVDKDDNKLRQLILMEEFKRCIQSNIRTFIDEQKVETLEDAARLVDEFSLSDKVAFVEKPKRPYPHLVKTGPLHYHDGLETKEITRMKIHGRNSILVTTLQIILTSGQEKRQISLSSQLHAFIVEKMDI